MADKIDKMMSDYFTGKLDVDIKMRKLEPVITAMMMKISVVVDKNDVVRSGNNNAETR